MIYRIQGQNYTAWDAVRILDSYIDSRKAWANDFGACHPDADPDEWIMAALQLPIWCAMISVWPDPAYHVASSSVHPFGPVMPGPMDVKARWEIRFDTTTERAER